MKKYLLLFIFMLCISAEKYEKYEVICNERYFKKLKTLIENSSEQICIVGLSMKMNTSINKQILTLLEKANNRGVKVRVLLEGDHKSLGKQNTKTMTTLTKAGINAKPDSSSHVIHAKLIVIDAENVLVGSTNLTYYSMVKNNESNLCINSKDAGDFYQNYFDSLWKDSGQSYSITKKSKNSESVYFSDSTYFDIVSKVIDQAKNEINVMMYMMKRGKTNSHPVEILLKKLVAAHKRGVRVKLVLEKSQRKSFNYHIYRFNKQAANFLIKNGITDITFDDSKQLTHSKIVWADNKQVVIGSYNWYHKGMHSNHQAGIVTSNKEAVKQLKKYFDNIYNHYKKIR